LDPANGANAIKRPVTIELDAKRIFINPHFSELIFREIISKEALSSRKKFRWRVL
jgi:hypothetical protein